MAWRAFLPDCSGRPVGGVRAAGSPGGSPRARAKLLSTAFWKYARGVGKACSSVFLLRHHARQDAFHNHVRAMAQGHVDLNSKVVLLDVRLPLRIIAQSAALAGWRTFAERWGPDQGWESCHL